MRIVALVNVAVIFVWLNGSAVQSVAFSDIRTHVVQASVVCALIMIVAVLWIIGHQAFSCDTLVSARSCRIVP